VFLGERSASAMGVDMGIEGGTGTRSNSSWGPFVGAHLEFRPIAGLRVGGYFSDTFVKPEDGRPTRSYISYVSVGGRLRYLHQVLPKLGVFATAGLGYVFSDYPGYEAAPQGIVNPTVSQQLGKIEVRNGSFLEAPIGAGVAYTAFAHTNLSLSLTWRPGFSFKGAAYEGEGSYARPTQGFSGSLGLSFFF
jgi:hypothetical protein